MEMRHKESRLHVIPQLDILYVRTSSDTQDVRMQLEMAKSFIPKQKLTFDKTIQDEGVSAIKLRYDQRPGLMEVIELIKSGLVRSLTVYHRDRLARDPYEYPLLIQLFYDYKIKVIFTASNTPVFSNVFLLEAMYGVLAFMEGRHINMRSRDANLQYPQSVFGYQKIKGQDGVQYQKDMQKAEQIRDFFHQVLQAQHEDDLVAALSFFKKSWKVTTEKILKMLSTPFYAGYYESQGKFIALAHVDAYLSLDEFRQMQGRLSEYKTTLDAMFVQTVPLFADVRCGVCHKPMIVKKKQGESVWWCCAKLYAGIIV